MARKATCPGRSMVAPDTAAPPPATAAPPPRTAAPPPPTAAPPPPTVASPPPTGRLDMSQKRVAACPGRNMVAPATAAPPPATAAPPPVTYMPPPSTVAPPPVTYMPPPATAAPPPVTSMPPPPTAALPPPTDAQPPATAAPPPNASGPSSSQGLNSEETTGTKRKRSHAKPSKGWNSGTQAVELQFNDYWQPVGKVAAKLQSQLGILARNGDLLPLTHTSWKSPDLGEGKERAWTQIKQNTNCPEEFKKNCMASLNKKWKDWKHEVHQEYLKYDNDEDRLANLPDRVRPDQWPILVKWFGSEEAQARSITSKINRNQQDDPHKTGRTSHAVIRHEAEEREERELDRIDMYFLTHVDKDGNPSSAKAAENMDKMTTKLAAVPVEERPPGYREKVFVEVMGPDGHGRVRTMGLGPTHRDVFGTSGSSRRSHQREMDEMRKELEIQFESKLQEQVQEAVAATSAQFMTELAKMKEMMSLIMQGQMGSSLPIRDDRVSPSHGSASHIGQTEASTSQCSLSHSPPSVPITPTHTIPITPASDGNGGTTQPSLSLGEPIVLFSWDEPVLQVAVGKFISNDPQRKVDNTIVGEGNLEVLVEGLIRPSYPLKYKRSDAVTLRQALKQSVIWPISKVIPSNTRRRVE